MGDPIAISIREAATVYGVSPITVRRAVRSKKLVPRAFVDALLAAEVAV